jgi:glycosyltransferase involved in cell wall biosynthesis
MAVEPPRQRRIEYAAGPGDLIGTYQYWSQGLDDQSGMIEAYSAQLFDVAKILNAKLAAKTFGKVRGTLTTDWLSIEQRPPRVSHSGRLGWLAGYFGRFFPMAWQMLWFRPQVAFMTESSAHLFLLPLLRLIGVRVVPVFHCVLYPQYQSKSRVSRFLARLAKPLFRTHAAAMLSASDAIARQVIEIAGGAARPIRVFMPTYRRDDFIDIAPAEAQRRPFRVIFAGRIEESKGVYDLLEVARRLRDLGRDDIVFDLCGKGAAFDGLAARVKELGLGDRFQLHGYCTRPTLISKFSASHAVIVPTRTEFVEGFNQVVAEAILSGRPVITSEVCPALEYVRDAAIEVPPNDVGAYFDAVVRLADDLALYELKRVACARLAEPFYDRGRSFGAEMLRTLESLGLANQDDLAAYLDRPAPAPRPRAESPAVVARIQ